MEPKECFGPWCLIHTMEFEPYHAIFKPSILRLVSRTTPIINFENLARQGHMDVDSPSITNGIVDHTIHRWLKALIHIQGCNKPRRHESTLHYIKVTYYFKIHYSMTVECRFHLYVENKRNNGRSCSCILTVHKDLLSDSNRDELNQGRLV